MVGFPEQLSLWYYAASIFYQTSVLGRGVEIFSLSFKCPSTILQYWDEKTKSIQLMIGVESWFAQDGRVDS